MWCMKKEGMKESREDYLETILVLNRKSPDDVRPVDVANHLGITKPSAYQKKRKRTSASYGVRP